MLKTNIYKSKLIVIQHFASLELELSESNTRLYRQALISVKPFFSSAFSGKKKCIYEKYLGGLKGLLMKSF